MSQSSNILTLGDFSVDLNKLLGKGSTGNVYKGIRDII